jgi:DNA-directed RNA polymerase subunit RPC12/RpoP
MPETSSLPTDFDDAPVVQSTKPEPKAAAKPAEKEPTGPAKDVDGIPYCRDHHVRMKRYSGGKKGSPTVYYKCPVKGCECKEQIINTKRDSVVPKEPVQCPHCSTPDRPVVCSKSKEHSSHGAVVLQCPECGWKSGKLAIPSLAAQHFEGRRMRVEPMGIGDR